MTTAETHITHNLQPFLGTSLYKSERTWVSCSWLCLDFFYCFCPEATFQLHGVRATCCDDKHHKHLWVTWIHEETFPDEHEKPAPQENTASTSRTNKIESGEIIWVSFDVYSSYVILILCMCLLLLFHTSLLRRLLSMLLAFKRGMFPELVCQIPRNMVY